MSILTHKKYSLLVSISALLVIVVVGVWSTVYVGNKIDKNERASILLRSKNISEMINQAYLKDLSGNANDMGKVSYENLKSTLISLRELNTDSRFIYLMGLRDGNQFFYIDSEDPVSEDYSPPGQEYTEATDIDLYNHTNGIAYTNGPYTDEWGTWISAYAPVIDKDTKQVIALIGIDVDADNLLSKVYLARWIVIALSFLIFLAMLLLVLLVQKGKKYEDTLEKLNKDLSIDKEYLLEVENIARLGQLTWSVQSSDVFLNKIIMDIIGINKSKLSIDELLEFVHVDDVIRIKKEFESMPEDTSLFNFKYRVTSSDKKEHTIISVCKIKRDSKNRVLRAMCTAQDIGDKLE